MWHSTDCSAKRSWAQGTLHALLAWRYLALTMRLSRNGVECRVASTALQGIPDVHSSSFTVTKGKAWGPREAIRMPDTKQVQAYHRLARTLRTRRWITSLRSCPLKSATFAASRLLAYCFLPGHFELLICFRPLYFSNMYHDIPLVRFQKTKEIIFP